MTISALIIVVVALINFIIALAGGDSNTMEVLLWVALSSILCLWIIVYPLSRLWIKNLNYIIRDDRITIHKDILTKIKQNIPYRAITDFALQRSIFDRILGIGSVKVQTAGQSQTTGYEGVLYGILDYKKLHSDLRIQISKLYPDSVDKTVSDTESDFNQEILVELRKVRKLLEKK